jgi:hypothetical protein
MKIKFPTYEIELSVEELKELSFSETLPEFLLKDSSDKPSISPKARLNNQNSRKISIETIKRIKEMAEEGKTNLTIASLLDLSPQLVNYWRRNTPKNILNDKNV